MTAQHHNALNDILDETADAIMASATQEVSEQALQGNQNVPPNFLNKHRFLILPPPSDEHIKRIHAEAEAQAASQRLVVAQQQMVEFLTERVTTEETLVSHVQRIQALLLEQKQTIQVEEELDKLQEALSQAAIEVKSVVTLMKEETQKQVQVEEQPQKRTSSQAEIAENGEDVEMATSSKRFQKEAGQTNSGSTATPPDGWGAANGDGTDGTGEEEDIDITTAQADITMNGNGNGNGSAAIVPQQKVEQEEQEANAVEHHDSFRERAKYIPIRLSHEERRILRLLEGALNVCEYTDKVDILSYRNKTQRIHAQIKDLCAILCGLCIAQNYKRGQQLIANRDFDQLAAFFQDCFEIGRRHKIMNPDKMRETYGKLCYMLMDSADPNIVELLEFTCVRPLKTVASVLETGGGLAMLDDPLMAIATAEIASHNRPRASVQKDIKTKERAREVLAKKYANPALPPDHLLHCLYSISDNNSFLAFSRDPVDRIIGYLKQYFRPDSFDPGLSLAIHVGLGGARLTHSHQRQYTYVLQSLTLWREILHEMFKLWCLAEGDMMSERNPYRLQNTGQGLNRVQSAPSVGRAMHAILARCQRRLGSWVGSAVVHLGDHNVPNALLFIDKYAQVPRILNPLVLVLDDLPRLVKDPALKKYVDAEFGGVEACRREILADFFRHAFDGSGADNFFDAGSCIDGRLTSAWQWCSKIEKKRYYPVFKLCNFVGFDGDWKG